MKKPTPQELADKLGLTKRQFEKLLEWDKIGLRYCSKCFKSFSGRRGSAFCSTSCQQKSYRARKKFEKLLTPERLDVIRKAWQSVLSSKKK